MPKPSLSNTAKELKQLLQLARQSLALNLAYCQRELRYALSEAIGLLMQALRELRSNPKAKPKMRALTLLAMLFTLAKIIHKLIVVRKQQKIKTDKNNKLKVKKPKPKVLTLSIKAKPISFKKIEIKQQTLQPVIIPVQQLNLTNQDNRADEVTLEACFNQIDQTLEQINIKLDPTRKQNAAEFLAQQQYRQALEQQDALGLAIEEYFANQSIKMEKMLTIVREATMENKKQEREQRTKLESKKRKKTLELNYKVQKQLTSSGKVSSLRPNLLQINW